VKGSKLVVVVVVVVEGGPHGLTWTHAEKVNRELLAFPCIPLKVGCPLIASFPR